jgi:hypothetical protein
MERELWPIRFVERPPARENGEEEQHRLRVKATHEGARACIRGMHQRWWFSWAGYKEAPRPNDADGQRKGQQAE